MYTVSFHAAEGTDNHSSASSNSGAKGSAKSISKKKKYKTESGAMKAMWNWLNANKGSVNYFSPHSMPQTFTDSNELPYEGTKTETDFYRTAKWLRLRTAAFEQFGNKCACCGATPDTGAVLHVDHIKPRSKYPHLALELDNLQILCEACNMGKLNVSETQWR
ncbi:HNH endonuclease signature motif containing protein [Psychrosphaera sp. 1_MG-2023]|uniref:HNH endonuclease n=1 Tax=Psychrosphaera sp. 1_MG-2023 TaxID=3062643 RepID=UPI0026E2738B|nr:HNH endonuclease signature motif containing protein [Psychrosphaera sp. 1_MG-2023]MDO6719561.1 HNH endonuclease signature motif containing protein [Psychrosphaera sp. 1_MG-2023]